MKDLTAIDKLTRDLRLAATNLSPTEARYLVDSYYTIQDDRKRTSNQERALDASHEPHVLVSWLNLQSHTLEEEIKKALDTFSANHPVGKWSRLQKGIGPVLAAGLLAHIDITKAPTVGHIWRFAGLDPTVKWGKGQKRPWNAKLKVLCWKIGESFVKVSGDPDALYGRLYANRKKLEEERNISGLFKDQAALALKEKKYSAETEAFKAYSQGLLPKARIHLRAQRYAVKMFLSHWHEVAYRIHFQQDPPKPYVIGIMGHVDYIPPPFMAEALAVSSE